jgi:hypothetical protein
MLPSLSFPPDPFRPTWSRGLFAVVVAAGVFSYPASFHFETGPEAAAKAPITATDYDVIVLHQSFLADAYQNRVVGGTGERRNEPGPSCLLILRRTP